MTSWMHNVIAGGIGGVNCGGVENDVIPGRGQELAINRAKLFMFLTSDAATRDLNIEEGYLKKVEAIFTTKTGRKVYDYKITEKAIRKYSTAFSLDLTNVRGI